MKSHRIIRTKTSSGIEREFDIAYCIHDAEIIRNNIEARCMVIRGELRYNITIGIPLGLDKEETDLVVLNTISNTLGVKEISEFSSTLDNRRYSMSAKILTQQNDYIGVEL